MSDNLLFYIVFLIQIILISFYFPRQIVRRVTTIFTTYPPAEYPRLYTKPLEVYAAGLKLYRILNHIVLGIGIILIAGLILRDTPTGQEIPQIVPFAYWVFQVIPLFLMELSGFAYFKLMRQADKRTRRQADLQPRRLFDFISPSLIGLAILLNLGCIVFYFYLDQFQFYWSSDTFVIALSILASNALYAGIIYRNLRGKKLDPYQAEKDRYRQIELSVKSLVFMSIMASIFLITIKMINQYNLDALEALIMSLYLQLTVLISLGSMLHFIKVSDIDFDVYKGETPRLS